MAKTLLPQHSHINWDWWVGFRRPLSAAKREWKTPKRKDRPVMMRGDDQFSTTIYSPDDLANVGFSLGEFARS